MAHGIEFFKAKTTRASTALAAALGLVLGLMSAPATAHDCERHNDPTHKHCGGGGGGGGNADPLPKPVIVFETTYSADKNDRLGIVDLDGNFAVILRSDEFWATKPHWMPNGRDVVFVSNWGGTTGIYRLQVVDDSDVLITDGTPVLILEAPVSSYTTFPNVADLGVDGLLLTFGMTVPDSQPSQHDIFVARLNPDGTAATPVNITNTPDVTEVWETLAPDGMSIAYYTKDIYTKDIVIREIDIVVVDISLVDGIPTAGQKFSLVLGTGSLLEQANEFHQRHFMYLDYSNATDEIVLSITPVPGTEDSEGNLWIVPVGFPENAYSLPMGPDIRRIQPSWSPDDTQLVHMQTGGPPCAQKKGRRVFNLVIRNFDGEPIAGCEAKFLLNFGRNPDWTPLLSLP